LMSEIQRVVLEFVRQGLDESFVFPNDLTAPRG